VKDGSKENRRDAVAVLSAESDGATANGSHGVVFSETIYRKGTNVLVSLESAVVMKDMAISSRIVKAAIVLWRVTGNDGECSDYSVAIDASFEGKRLKFFFSERFELGRVVLGRWGRDGLASGGMSSGCFGGRSKSGGPDVISSGTLGKRQVRVPRTTPFRGVSALITSTIRKATGERVPFAPTIGICAGDLIGRSRTF
jgi:hypothetical protein